MVRFVDLGPDERTENAPAAGDTSAAGASVGAPESAQKNTAAPLDPGAPLNPWASAARDDAPVGASVPSEYPAQDTVVRGAWGRVQEQSAAEPSRDLNAAFGARPDADSDAEPATSAGSAESSVSADVRAPAVTPVLAITPVPAITPVLADVSPLAERRRRRKADAPEAASAAQEERECVVTAFPGAAAAAPAVAPADAAPIAAFEEYPDSEIPTLAQRFGLDEDLDDDESAEYEPDPVDPEAVREDLVRRLARSALSQAEVVAEGIDRGLDPDQAEEARAWLEQLGYLDDAVLAEEMKHRLYDRKGKSRSVVAREMSMRKIDREIIDAVLSDVADEDELDAALALAEKRAGSLRGLDRATAERRLNGFLARRGYPGSVVREAVSRALGPKSPVRFR